jgi:hypothetical protein
MRTKCQESVPRSLQNDLKSQRIAFLAYVRSMPAYWESERLRLNALRNEGWQPQASLFEYPAESGIGPGTLQVSQEIQGGEVNG